MRSLRITTSRSCKPHAALLRLPPTLAEGLARMPTEGPLARLSAREQAPLAGSHACRLSRPRSLGRTRRDADVAHVKSATAVASAIAVELLATAVTRSPWSA